MWSISEWKITRWARYKYTVLHSDKEVNTEAGSLSWCDRLEAEYLDWIIFIDPLTPTLVNLCHCLGLDK